jgi:hypothetical protein
MREGMKIAVKRLIRGERGQALILVLILLLVGGLVIAPLLDFMGTGLKVGKGVYENKMYETYAADAGVEHALSLLKYDDLVDLFPDYDEYDYSTQWDYNLDDGVVGVGELVNNKSVHVTIENVWMPKDIIAPDTVTARQIIEGGKLIISGGPSVTAESTYEIKLSYAWTCGNDLLLDVSTIGIWLPPGFEYAGSCSLEGESYYSEPQIDAYKGGYAVVWNFASVRLSSFPGDDLGPPMIKSFTFEYKGPAGQSPDNAVSWIDTSGVAGVTYTWDADVKIYKILSVAGSCEVEAYVGRVEVRKLGAAISGDYDAIGNTLMTSSGYPYYPYYRNRLYRESSATVAVGDIPSNAIIEAGWLYWSGWIEGAGGAGQEVWSDSCGNFNDWTHGNHWSIWYGEFQGQGGGTDAQRTLTMYISSTPNHCLDLSSYAGQEVTVSWDQREVQTGWGWPWPELEPGDCLKYAFSGDGGTTWSGWDTAFCNDNPSSSFSDTIPDVYLTNRFKMRFLLGFDETNEYCYIDDITISVSAGSSVEDAKVNRVMFNGNQITTSQWQVEPTPDSGAPDSWCYSCFYDATQIVRAALDPDTKSGTFTLGHVLEGSGYNLYPSGTTGYPLSTPALSTALQYQWTYAGWSLVIIYSSPETQGHQLYLFDTLHYVAVHTSLDFPISGFLVPDPVGGEQNAAHITCFVGDGDEHYPYDFIALLDAEPSVPSYQIPDEYKLWDGIDCNRNSPSSPNNVWNSKSTGLAASGVDVDTFQVTWSSGLLEPGDTSAWVELGNASSNPLDGELIVLVYIIVSFRSATTSGGSISYLIRG